MVSSTICLIGTCIDESNPSLTLRHISLQIEISFRGVGQLCMIDLRQLLTVLLLCIRMDEINLWYQYDMRGSFMNLTQVAEQIPLIKDRSAFLSWYTADEPDGWQYALDSTRLVYDLLKEKDPYRKSEEYKVSLRLPLRQSKTFTNLVPFALGRSDGLGLELRQLLLQTVLIWGRLRYGRRLSDWNQSDI